MADKKYLIFDFGASNGRAIVASFDGKRFDMEVTHRFDNGPVWAAGTLYWDLLHLVDELKTGLRASLRDHGPIESLAIDTWGCDFGFIDRRGKLLNNPVNYRDPRRHELAAELHKEISPREIFELGGSPVIDIMSLYQMYAFRHDGAVEMTEGDRFLMMPDLLNYELTGRPVNEFTNATMTLMCNQVTRNWESVFFEKLGFDRSQFADPVMPGTVLGPVRGEVCRELEIDPVQVVAPATHDTASAVAGIPVTADAGHWAFISMGTWCIGGIEPGELLINDDVFESGYGNQGGVEGRNMLVRLLTGLWIVQQCREKWVKDKGADIAWDEIVAACGSLDGGTPLIDVDDARFGEPHVDMPSVVADWCEATGQTRPGGMGEIARCVYASLVMKFRENMRTLHRLTGKPIDRLHLVGGGVQNRMLCQWTADAMGVPVVAGPTETTSVGNLLAQLLASGEISSVPEGREIAAASCNLEHYEPSNTAWWDDAFERYEKVVGQMV